MKRSILVLASLLALPFATQAADLSYSWVEADYVHVDPDHFDNTNGVAIRGSGAINDNFNVIAGWSKLNNDAPFADSKSWYVGLGYHVPVADQTDLFTEVAYAKETSFDVDGYNARVGVRSALSPRFEGSVWLGYSKFERNESNAALGVSGQYKFTPTVGLVAEASVGDNDKSFLIGPRLSF